MEIPQKYGKMGSWGVGRWLRLAHLFLQYRTRESHAIFGSWLKWYAGPHSWESPPVHTTWSRINCQATSTSRDCGRRADGLFGSFPWEGRETRFRRVWRLGFWSCRFPCFWVRWCSVYRRTWPWWPILLRRGQGCQGRCAREWFFSFEWYIESWGRLDGFRYCACQCTWGEWHTFRGRRSFISNLSFIWFQPK